MMAVAEADLVSPSEVLVAFCSSLPLFTAEGSFPIEFWNKIVRDVSPPNFVARAAEILSRRTPRPLRARAVDAIRKLHGTRKWPVVLTAYAVLIADELARDSPDTRLIGGLFAELLVPLGDRSIEALVVIRSLFMYSDVLRKLIPGEFRSFVSGLAKISVDLTPADPPEWVFQLTKLTAYAFIHNYRLPGLDASYANFAKFLATHDIASFTTEIREVFRHLADLLVTFYGSYPFHESIFFPSRQDETLPIESVYVSELAPLLRLSRTDGKVEVLAHTGSGLFSWTFKEVDERLYDSQTAAPFSVPLSSQQSELPPSIELQSEKELSSVFDSVLGTLNRSWTDTITDAERTKITGVAHAMNSESRMQRVGTPDRTPMLRPPVKATDSAVGALECCGLYDGTQPSKFGVLDETEKASLIVKKLQSLNHRLQIKIGVLFVRDDCVNQNDILATTYDQTSPHFREFITALGWPVLLDRHVGYDGGLDIKRNGRTSIYYADFSHEVMFHIAPLIPTDNNDAQQTYKKRHIGNDHVHIVWCEAIREYDPSTITSQFNQVHIMIYPLETGVFRVDVKWKKDVGWFGPLRWSSVVLKKSLPSLVRATAIAAMDTFHRRQSPFADPQNQIAAATEELAGHRGSGELYSAVEHLMKGGDKP
jgi:hypothetical protein